jgi:Uma2 family endonuclease
MTLSPEHERYKHLLRRLLETVGEELNVPIEGLGSTTFRRRDLARGLEPDECYYIQNWARVRGKKHINLAVDPPPDLVVEIDVTRSSLDRMSIYSSLRVPEVWRFEGHLLQIFRLEPDGTYKPYDGSATFVNCSDWVRFLQQGDSQGETVMIRAFRAWIRQKLTSK